MNINKGTKPEVGPKILDVNFISDGKTVKTTGYVKSASNEATVIKLDINDKKMTPLIGTDIHLSKKNIPYKVIDSKHFPEVKVVGQRGHARVEDILKVDYKKISQEDYKRWESKPEVIFKNTFGEFLKVPEIEEVTLEVLYKLIYQTNLKIERILDILESKDTERYASVSSEYADISGSGMRFVSDRSFSIGDIIALRVFLPLTYRPFINVLGKVISITDTEPDSKHKYNVSVEFTGLSERDREMIIRYVFKRQRELLRFTSDVKNQD